MFYRDLKNKKERVRNFIKNNPLATQRLIKRKLKIKIEKVYSNGMGEAFRDAGIKSPRVFERKTIQEKREILIKYIKKNPNAGGYTIKKETKINILSVFKSTSDLFRAAGLIYPRAQSYNLNPEDKRKEIINLVKKNSQITLNEIIEKTGIKNPLKLFKNFDEIYQKIGVQKISGGQKRTLKIKNKVISFIKLNPLATQREVNAFCRTHVQDVFNDGIFEAYDLAGVKYPFERLKLYGVGLKKIRERAKIFEEKIALKLSGFGAVNRLIKTKRGVADIVFERNGKKAIIEVKDYRAKEISISEAKQLNKYLEDFGCNLGFIICHKKPKRNKFLMDKNRIIVLEELELKEIPSIIGGIV